MYFWYIFDYYHLKYLTVFNIWLVLHIFFVLVYIIFIFYYVSDFNTFSTTNISKYVDFQYALLFVLFHYFALDIVCIFRIFVILTHFLLLPIHNMLIFNIWSFLHIFFIFLYINCIFFVSYFKLIFRSLTFQNI